MQNLLRPVAPGEKLTPKVSTVVLQLLQPLEQVYLRAAEKEPNEAAKWNLHQAARDCALVIVSAEDESLDAASALAAVVGYKLLYALLEQKNQRALRSCEASMLYYSQLKLTLLQVPAVQEYTDVVTKLSLRLLALDGDVVNRLRDAALQELQDGPIRCSDIVRELKPIPMELQLEWLADTLPKTSKAQPELNRAEPYVAALVEQAKEEKAPTVEELLEESAALQADDETEEAAAEEKAEEPTPVQEEEEGDFSINLMEEVSPEVRLELPQETEEQPEAAQPEEKPEPTEPQQPEEIDWRLPVEPENNRPVPELGFDKDKLEALLMLTYRRLRGEEEMRPELRANCATAAAAYSKVLRYLETADLKDTSGSAADMVCDALTYRLFQVSMLRGHKQLAEVAGRSDGYKQIRRRVSVSAAFHEARPAEDLLAAEKLQQRYLNAFRLAKLTNMVEKERFQ